MIAARHRLKAFLAEGIVEVSPASDRSVYREYVITGKGEALLPTLVAPAQWSSEYLFDRREVRSVPLDAKVPPAEKACITFCRWAIARCRRNSAKGVQRLTLVWPQLSVVAPTMPMSVCDTIRR